MAAAVVVGVLSVGTPAAGAACPFTSAHCFEGESWANGHPGDTNPFGNPQTSRIFYKNGSAASKTPSLTEGVVYHVFIGGWSWPNPCPGTTPSISIERTTDDGTQRIGPQLRADLVPPNVYHRKLLGDMSVGASGHRFVLRMSGDSNQATCWADVNVDYVDFK